MSSIQYGSQNYQVSAEFRSTLLRAIDDQQISVQERNVLAQQAKSADEQSFLENHVQIQPGQATANFEPSQLSFREDFAPRPSQENPNVTRGEAYLARYHAENPIPLDAIPAIQAGIAQLRESGEVNGANRIQAMLDEKIDQAVRYQLSHLDVALTAASRDGQISPEENRYFTERSELIQGYMAHSSGLSESTQQMGQLIQLRLDQALNGVFAPSQSEVSDNPNLVAGRANWDVSAGVALSSESSPAGGTETVRAAVAGTYRGPGGTQVTGILGFSQVRTQPNPEASAGLPANPRQPEEGTRFGLGVEVDNGPSRYRIEGQTNGDFAVSYERRLNRDATGEVRVSRDGEETRVEARLRLIG